MGRLGESFRKRIKGLYVHKNLIIIFALIFFTTSFIIYGINALYLKLYKKTPSLTEKEKEQIALVYLQYAFKDVSPDIETRLISEKKKEVYEAVKRELDVFIQEYSDVESFLDWYFGWFNQYKMLFYKMQDTINKGINKVKSLKGIFSKDLNALKGTAEGNQSKFEQYMLEHIEKYLISQDKFKTFVDERITPILQRESREFAKELVDIVEARYYELIDTNVRLKIENEIHKRIFEEFVNKVEQEYEKPIKIKVIMEEFTKTGGAIIAGKKVYDRINKLGKNTNTIIIKSIRLAPAILSGIFTYKETVAQQVANEFEKYLTNKYQKLYEQYVKSSTPYELIK
ncbi:MAG: hypothetical protein GXO04_06040 [Aquificae bacterium]|nr:hypothetical protein [Aquificota bacterium]